MTGRRGDVDAQYTDACSGFESEFHDRADALLSLYNHTKGINEEELSQRCHDGIITSILVDVAILMEEMVDWWSNNVGGQFGERPVGEDYDKMLGIQFVEGLDHAEI